MDPMLPSSATRRKQLSELLDAIDALCSYLPKAPDYSDAAAILVEHRTSVVNLLESGFDQDKLSACASAIRPLIHTHKEWIPPLVERSDGGWQVPKWFPEFERLHESMVQKAAVLRVIGER